MTVEPEQLEQLEAAVRALREAYAAGVYDLFGRRVADLPRGVLDPGTHRVVIDSGILPSGVYMFRLETTSAVLSGKLQVVR